MGTPKTKTNAYNKHKTQSSRNTSFEARNRSDTLYRLRKRHQSGNYTRKEKESSLAKMNTLIEIIAITWLATGILLPLIITTYYK